MKFHDKYPALANFLGAWFPDADLEDLEDQEVVANFLQTPNQNVHNAVRIELGRLLNNSDLLPYEDISQEANRYFENERECRSWLLMVKDKLG